MPNKALERLMGCLFASIDKKEKKRELHFLSASKLKHTDKTGAKKRKKAVHGGRQDARVSLWNSQYCQASVGEKESAQGMVGVAVEQWKPQT